MLCQPPTAGQERDQDEPPPPSLAPSPLPRAAGPVAQLVTGHGQGTAALVGAGTITPRVTGMRLQSMLQCLAPSQPRAISACLGCAQWLPGLCTRGLRGVWVRDTAWGPRARPVMEQWSGFAMIRVGVRFNLGTEDRWQCHAAQGKGTTVGALQGWCVGVELGFPLGIYWGHWAEDHVSQEGGLGQVRWQEYPQPGEMGPRRRGGVWSLWGSVSPGCPVPTFCCYPVPHDPICSLD